MLPDIVIDTNVLCHAGNPTEPRHAAALALVVRLLDISTRLCVDEGFSLDEAINQSHICAEYLAMLVPGSVAFVVLVRLATSGRVREVNRRPDTATARRIMQVVRKPRDRIFVGVAHNSVGKTLVSHDYVDFAAAKRRMIKRDIGVSILECGDCSSFLA